MECSLEAELELAQSHRNLGFGEIAAWDGPRTPMRNAR